MITPTTMTNSTPDFRKTHFPHPDLERIHGPPTIEQILRLHRQLKQNAASVPCNLGGAQHGFLPLVITEAQWLSIPNVIPFERPLDPGPFTLQPARQTNAEVAMAKARWEQRKANYINYQHLEATLRNLLTSAFDYDVLDTLRDRITHTITCPIPEIIQFLFEEYGDLSPDDLLTKEDTIKNYVYDPSLPVSTVFNEIIGLKDLYELTGSTLEDAAMIRIGFSILNRAKIFKDGLMAWNNLPTANKTWATFQSHFRKHHRDLKRVNALQIQDSSINHAQILNELKTHQQESLTSITNAFTDNLTHTINMMQDSTEDHNINASSTQSLRQEINELRSLILKLTTDKQISTRKQKKPRQYCWTHGWCAHNGTECQAPSDGHIPSATLDNKAGGSNKNCPTK